MTISINIQVEEGDITEEVARLLDYVAISYEEQCLNLERVVGDLRDQELEGTYSALQEASHHASKLAKRIDNCLTILDGYREMLEKREESKKPKTEDE